MLHRYARLDLRGTKSSGSETGKQDFMLGSHSSRLLARNYAHQAVLSVAVITVRIIPLRGNMRKVSDYFFNNPDINIIVNTVKIIAGFKIICVRNV